MPRPRRAAHGRGDRFRGWGRALRRAVGGWYAAKAPDQLAYQAVKYRSRDGYTHRDLLRLAHPGRAVGAGNPALEVTDAHAALFEWIVRGTEEGVLPRIVEGFALAQAATDPARTAQLVREYRLPREAVRPEHLVAADVWAALLEAMPTGAPRSTRRSATSSRRARGRCWRSTCPAR